MSVSSPDVIELESLDADWDVPCDYFGKFDQNFCASNGTDPAEWVLHVRCPDCGAGAPRLVCARCKDHLTSCEHGGYCQQCEVRIVPFRKVVHRIEPLKKAG